MTRTLRVGLVVLGAAMAVYGAASLTGGWLGTPPWWENREPRLDLIVRRANRIHFDDDAELLDRAGADQRVNQNALEGSHRYTDVFQDDPAAGERFEGEFGITLRPARQWTSGAVVAAGLALVAVGAWPRRRAGVVS